MHQSALENAVYKRQNSKVFQAGEGEGVKTRVCRRSGSLRFEEDCDSGHVLLVDCTLNLVLRGFGRRIQFLPVVLPQACPVIRPSCLLVH